MDDREKCSDEPEIVQAVCLECGAETTLEGDDLIDPECDNCGSTDLELTAYDD